MNRLFQIKAPDFTAGFITTEYGLAIKAAPKISGFVWNRGIDKISLLCQNLHWELTEIQTPGQ